MAKIEPQFIVILGVLAISYVLNAVLVESTALTVLANVPASIQVCVIGLIAVFALSRANRAPWLVRLLNALIFILCLLCALVAIRVPITGVISAFEAVGIEALLTTEAMPVDAGVCIVILLRVASPRAMSAVDFYGRLYAILAGALLSPVSLIFTTHYREWQLDEVGFSASVSACFILLVSTRAPIRTLFKQTPKRLPEITAGISVFLSFSWLIHIVALEAGPAKYVAIGALAVYFYVLSLLIRGTSRQEQLVSNLINRNRYIENQKNRFELIARGLSHDLKSPVRNAENLIANWDSFRNEQQFSEDDLRRLVLENLARADRLSSRFIEYIRAGTDAEKKAKVDLPFYLGAIAKRYQGRARIEVNCDIRHTVSLSSDNIQRIIENLIENAIAHNPTLDDLSISITATLDEKWLKIAVEDNGQGIPSKYWGRIFKPFETLSSKSGTTNAGLGLSICQELARTMDGHLSISEPQSGKGACFHLNVPI